MADQAAIDSVKIQLPSEAAQFGITDTIIGSQLDSSTQTKTILFFLRAIAAKVASLESISESGSSRTTMFHQNLMAMITDWQSRSDAEDAQKDALLPKRPGASHTSVRV